FTRELARRLARTGVTVNAVHPGGVATRLGQQRRSWIAVAMKLGRPFMRTPAEGAATSIYVATAPELATVSGRYFADCHEAATARAASGEEAARRLWDVSCRMTGWL